MDERGAIVDGMFGAANVPIRGDGELRAELWGSTGGRVAQRLAAETIHVAADGLTWIDLGPERADGPTCE